jgi:hypothetical protein
MTEAAVLEGLDLQVDSALSLAGNGAEGALPRLEALREVQSWVEPEVLCAHGYGVSLGAWIAEVWNG